MVTTETTGHSRHLRNVLRAAREKRGLSQREVAEAVTARLSDHDKHISSTSISAYETFTRHPPINVMAAWARVLGFRLIVELDDAASQRVVVSLRPRAADVARLLDLLPDPDLAMVQGMIERLTPAKR